MVSLNRISGNFSVCKSLSISILMCLSFSAEAQERRAQIIQAKLASGYGSVLSVDDEIVKGKLIFNDNLGIVTVEADGESRSFTSKKAMSFEFEDMNLGRHRVFQVLDHTDKFTGFTNLAFFEILAEFKSFAVLSKIDPVEVKAQKGILPRVSTTMVGSDHTKVAFQTETIFIMNETGANEPYLELTEKEIEGVYFDTRSNRKKFIDRNLLEEYTGTLYAELEIFASANNLRFNVKEELIKILDYYRSLIDN